MATQVLNIFGPKKNSQDMVGIELDEDHLKFVHVRTSGLRREVATLLSHEVRGMTDDDVVEFIGQTLRSLNLQNPRAFIIVPLHLVITRSIEVPSIDPDEIREIVNLQASRHTPYSRAEIIVDMLPIGSTRENYTKVLLVIIPKEVVTRQQRIVERAGLVLEKVFFPPEGISVAFIKMLGSEIKNQAIAVVHMDWGFTSFMVVENQKIIFVRGISVGATHLLDEKEVYHDRFIEELSKSVESYAADEVGASPKTLYLTGVISDITDLDEMFTQAFQAPIKHQTYFNTFAIWPAAKKVAESSKRISFFNVIAPLLLYDKIQVDLASDEQKLKASLEKKTRQLLKTGTMVVIILVLLFVLLAIKLQVKQTYFKNLEKRYNPVIEEAKETEKIFAKTQVVKDYLASRGHSIQVLSNFYEAIPPEVRITSLKYDEKTKFNIRGTSSSAKAVFDFINNLARSKDFKKVENKQNIMRNENGVDVTDFELDCGLNYE